MSVIVTNAFSTAARLPQVRDERRPGRWQRAFEALLTALTARTAPTALFAGQEAVTGLELSLRGRLDG